MDLREHVLAWKAQTAKCGEAFAHALEGINRELSAVGGYATTSPSKDGYCRTFWWIANEKSWSEGVVKVGDRRHDDEAPTHPEVGDRCHALETLWRAEAYKLVDATKAVRAYVAQTSGLDVDRDGLADLLAHKGLAPEHIAAAMVADQVTERGAIIAWLRSQEATGVALTNRIPTQALADAVERGDHLR